MTYMVIGQITQLTNDDESNARRALIHEITEAIIAEADGEMPEDMNCDIIKRLADMVIELRVI